MDNNGIKATEKNEFLFCSFPIQDMSNFSQKVGLDLFVDSDLD